MLAIAKAVKSLHKNNLSHLQLNLKDIFLNRKKKVVIDSIFNSEIKILTTKPKEQKSIS
jgi:tRNA A-37 threonylcarbamoyl transferase component Bud32